MAPFSLCKVLPHLVQLARGHEILVGYVCSEVLDRVLQWQAAGLPMTYGRVAAGRSEGDNRAPDRRRSLPRLLPQRMHGNHALVHICNSFVISLILLHHLAR